MKAEKVNASKGIKLNFAVKSRGGSQAGGTGGHWNAKLRRFTVPAKLAGTRVGFATAGEFVVILKDGDFAVHPKQRFVTVPKATAELLGETRTLQVDEIPEDLLKSLEIEAEEIHATYKI